MTPAFSGSSPYCYSNSLAMVLGADSPAPSAIEVLTGSPFGAQLVEGGLPHFDPLGWDPDLGLDQAIDLLGWTCQRASGGDVTEAIGRLRQASKSGPVLVGPVDLGLLLHQPWSAGEANGGDHWVVVLDVDDEKVLFHDPDGFPFATLPIGAFAAAWNSELVDCAGPFTMRSGFRRVRQVNVLAALRSSLPTAQRWLVGGRQDERRAGHGGLGAGAAVERLAAYMLAGLDDRTRGHLAGFAVRVGTRRLSDASLWLAEVGAPDAAEIADFQARLLGSVQYSLVAGETQTAAATLRQLAATYDDLRAAVAAACGI
ncbi:hypothetical protein [Streptomyces lavenduligriseus]|uniref:Butirosin biosynthesis protein H N-terminal domain-containing protein n=1 Tax=Streptomyces lavenduligriseus TaxID=67315 RepID=A0ABT0NVK2_9ACTN|nr:hypothetical protein [Streptomyces lavenduligriseus]MCL3995472.1 hypothetical protein [Streptomyces lavenduligriseus]